MVSIHKRGAIYGVIALMLVVAVYLNWSYVRSPDDVLTVGKQTGDAAAGALKDSKATATDTAAGALNDSKATATDAAATQAEGAAETANAAAVSTSNYFAQSRLSREQARDEAISILKETTESDKADQDAKTEASDKISALAENSVQEARVESLIKAKGYDEAVVFIGDDSVNVIVQPPQAGFEASDASKIRDIVVSETGVGADKIKIVEAA